MKKITFNHEGEKLTDTLGITNKRYDQIITEIKGNLVSTTGKSSDYLMEQSLTAIEPKNEAELFMTGYILGRLIAKYFSSDK